MVLVAQTLPAVPDRLDGLTSMHNGDGLGLLRRPWDVVCHKDCSAFSDVVITGVSDCRM